MIKKISSILFKLYLSLQAFVILVGLGSTIFNVAAFIHDIEVSRKAKSCLLKYPSPQVRNFLRKNNDHQWLDEFEKYIAPNEALVYSTKRFIDSNCTSYLDMYIYDSSREISISIMNWLNSSPPDPWERVGYVFLSVLIPAGIVVVNSLLMLWIKWLSK